MDAGSLMGVVRDGLTLRWETPFSWMCSAAAFLAFLSGGSTFATPTAGLSRFLTWLGWSSAAAWPDHMHAWLANPLREPQLYQLFFFLALAGFGCSAYGTRLVFFGALSVGGLAELGAATAAWIIPLSATVLSCVIGRLVQSRQSDPWDHARKTFLNAALAIMYLPLSVIALVAGERQETPAARVTVEFDWETKRYIDKRLTAMGMPSLDRPMPGFDPLPSRRIHPPP